MILSKCFKYIYFLIKTYSYKGLVSKIFKKVSQLHNKTTSNEHVDKILEQPLHQKASRCRGRTGKPDLHHLRGDGTAVTHTPTMERQFTVFSEQQTTVGLEGSSVGKGVHRQAG